jgi:hypothetical protein
MLSQIRCPGFSRRSLELLDLFRSQHIRQIKLDPRSAHWLFFRWGTHGVSCLMQRRLLRHAQNFKKNLCITQNIFYSPTVHTETNIRAELHKAAAKRGETSRLSEALGIAPSTVTRWIAGGPIPPPMIKLLDLYFFDVMPFDIVGEKLVESVLDFTEDQWKVICILAKRQGIPPAKWISNQIRTILAHNDEAIAERKEIEHARKSGTVSPLYEVPKVADDVPEQGKQQR